jgi:anti-sigma regulatory factor (Ser/Thr protein kinase)
MEGLAPPARASDARNSSVLIAIDEQSQVGAARRAAVSLAHAHGLTSDAIARLAIVVTEAATNVLRHARGGTIVLRPLLLAPAPGIEMMALDKGPGIADLARAMRDGFSTTGTSGHGLGGIRRLADLFDVYSQEGNGTVLLARVGHEAGASAGGRKRVASMEDRLGVISTPIRGEKESGDAWRLVAGRKSIVLLVVDGLGHGPEAAKVAIAATAKFGTLANGSSAAAVTGLNVALRGSRGAALSVVMIDETLRTASFSGVGNVDGRVLSPDKNAHLVPQNGIVGHVMPTVKSISADWPPNARLVMHTDGLSARWRLDAYPGLLSAHPALIAGVIFRDFTRDRDDSTVLVLADAVAASKS